MFLYVNWEYGKQICKQGSILSLVTLCEYVPELWAPAPGTAWMGRGCRGVAVRGSEHLQQCYKVPLYCDCCSVWNCEALCWVIFFLSDVLILHIVHLFIAEIISVAAGEGGKKKDCLRTGRKCLVKQRMCVIRFFLFGFNCALCGTCFCQYVML